MSGDTSRQDRRAAPAHEPHVVDSKPARVPQQYIHTQQQQEQQSQGILNVCDAIQSAGSIATAATAAVATSALIAAIASVDLERKHTMKGDRGDGGDDEEEEKKEASGVRVAASAAFEPLRRTVTMPLRIDTTVSGRLSPHLTAHHRGQHSNHNSSASTAGVGAPPVWISPDWATYPIIENFYGQPRRTRVSSFYEVMCSPTNLTQTTTLAENCCAYGAGDSELDDADADVRRRLTGDDGVAARPGAPVRRRKLGSFAYSCSTETSDDGDILPSPFAAGSLGDECSGEDARAKPSSSAAPASGSGFAAWNRIRRTVGDGHNLVPVPNAGNALHRGSQHAASRFGNPQAGSAEQSPSDAGAAQPESPAATTPPTTSRLRFKLLDALTQIDARIAREHELLLRAQASAATKKPAAKALPSGVWSLFCGAKPFELAQNDGLARLHEQLGVAVRTRALNQLQRHRRHVRGILQIVTSHNPDLALTEKQLDSFESADAMLANDIKFSVLQQQVASLATSLAQRTAALTHAKARNGADCFEHPRVKSAMLTKLLEAVSWYRLVQTNARDESALSAVGAPQDADGGDAAAGPVRSLQELQVEKILSVLAGEDFYSDYSDLMCAPAWWDIAQAHFENLVFANAESRVCQWMSRLAHDVASVSQEALEDADVTGGAAPGKPLRVLSERRASFTDGVRSHSTRLLAQHQHQQSSSSNWASDPQPEQLLEFVERLTRRIRRDFEVPNDVSKSLSVFVQRAVFPRAALLCFNQKAVRECQRKDKLWRKQCVELSGVEMERLSVPHELAEKIRSQLPSRRVRGKCVYLVRAIDAFSAMRSIVPCDLLDELMHGVVVLHHEAARVLGTTQFSVETFFPLLAYALLHCALPRLHAQLHVLESFAITNSNVNGEESYYVYCVHAAVEYICNSAGLTAPPPPSAPPRSPASLTTTMTMTPAKAAECKAAATSASVTPTRAAELASSACSSAVHPLEHSEKLAAASPRGE